MADYFFATETFRAVGSLAKRCLRVNAMSFLFLIILIANGLMECLLRGLLFFSAVNSLYRPYRQNSSDRNIALSDLLISTHVAISNEPPILVIATLRAIAASSFQNFEVIVIDNNTHDERVWRPVEVEVRELGNRFRFLHFDSLPDAKAGALNVALHYMDPRATHVAVVDADYQISPTFFIDALRAIVATDVDYVQFPQAYRGVSPCGRGVEQELNDYFACFASGAGRPGSMLPTGTLSLFSAVALRSVGGWGVRTITEDAELGVRLQGAGYRGLWRADRAGHGLLPVDFRGLASQRARWAAGNMQVLLQVVAERSIALSVLDFINFVAQLTAWISLWGLPAAGLMFAALFPSAPLSGLIGGVAAGTIVVSSVLTTVRMAMLVESQDGRWRVQLTAIQTKLALTWTSAFAWTLVLASVRMRFHRTPKTSSGDTADSLPILLLVSLGFGFVSLQFISSGQFLQASACAMLAAIWWSARSTDRRLRATAALNGAHG